MPRASREQAEQHRIEIEGASVRLFKERGINGVSVADVMATAGLTHGGFYGHFKSKDDLATIACIRAFEESLEKWHAMAEGDATDADLMAALANHYLSEGQRDDVGLGCPISAFATDISREAKDKPIRKAYLQGLSGLIDVLMSFSRKRQSKRVKQQALVRLSMLVGALTLSRAVKGSGLSEEILESVKGHFKAEAKASAVAS